MGKTYLLKAFGKAEFKNTLYINFEESPTIKKFFEEDLSPQKIIRNLSLYFNVHIDIQNTLIIFDEIQECPNALTSLKYFQEHANEYFIAAAGSLLGIKLSQAKGFPVGKVNFLTLYPCSFFEFLDATNNEKLRTFLDEIKIPEPIPAPLHDKLNELLRFYFFVGGMPEAVKAFSTNENIDHVRQIQQDILQAYLLDFSKHAPPHKITSTWQSISSQLAKENKKFMYSLIEKDARSRTHENAIQWLADADLIHRSFCVSTPRLPIDSYANKKIFKLFMLDIGLLNTQNQLPIKILLEGDQLFVEFKGALTENFVAQELKATHNSELYYWASEGKAEVDFIFPYEGNIYPLEVKSGKNSKQKSLTVYTQKYHPRISVRTSPLNLNERDHFCNYPLYLISKFPLPSQGK